MSPFRKAKHIWYWMLEELVNWFKAQGFVLVYGNKLKIQLGLDGIRIYVFYRI